MKLNFFLCVALALAAVGLMFAACENLDIVKNLDQFPNDGTDKVPNDDPGIISVTGVSFDETDITIKAGKTFTLIPAVVPHNAKNKLLKWESSETNVADVDENGIVTAKTAGTTVITAATNDGNHEAACTVSVVDMVKIIIVSKPAKSVHKTGDRLDVTGLVVVAVYSDDSMDNITITSDNITGYNNTKIGKQILTVNYNDFNAQYETYVSLIDQVWINPGTFIMGSYETGSPFISNEVPHHVTLTQGFRIGKYQITQAQYEAVMGTNPSHFNTSVDGDNPENRPVDSVTWYDALEFCNKLSEIEGLTPYYNIDKTHANSSNLNPYDSVKWFVTDIINSDGYRLPTEAQWEYACRAGTETFYNWGENYTDDTLANYDSRHNTMFNVPGKFPGRTKEAGSYAPNSWGLYDMHGNVSEWCWDWYGEYQFGTQVNPPGPVSGVYRILRGGSWKDESVTIRSSYRYWGNAAAASRTTGFRIAR